jgi:hypothetical protein
MTREVLTVKEATPLHEVAYLMEQRNIKRLPVVRAGKVAGIISRANLLRALASLRRESPTRETSGAAIRNRILRGIAKRDWAYGCDVDVIVRNGVARSVGDHIGYGAKGRIAGSGRKHARSEKGRRSPQMGRRAHVGHVKQLARGLIHVNAGFRHRVIITKLKLRKED